LASLLEVTVFAGLKLTQNVMKSFLRFGRCFRILEGEVEDFMSVIQQFFHFDDGLEELVLGSTDVSHFAIIEFLSVG